MIEFIEEEEKTEITITTDYNNLMILSKKDDVTIMRNYKLDDRSSIGAYVDMFIEELNND